MNRHDRRKAAAQVPRPQRAQQKRTREEIRGEQQTQLRTRVEAELDRRKVKLPLLASTAHSRLDLHIERELAHLGSPTLSCTPGCSACCRQLVTVSAAEAGLILARYPELVEEVRPVLQRHVEIGDHVFPHKQIDPIQAPEKLQELAEVWWVQRQDCAFLGDDKRCRIYDVRPFACRRYYVVSDPELCGAPISTDVFVWVPSTAASINAGLWDAEADDQGRILVGPLPHVLLSVEKGIRVLETMQRENDRRRT